MESLKGTRLSALRMADAPFNDEAGPAADVIFITSDDVQFHVSRSILMFSSPVFKDMFTIAHSPSGVTQEPVRVTEDSSTFDCLLRLCYPVPAPRFDELPLLGRVLEAARKYDMEEMESRARSQFGRFITSNPLDSFVVACRLRLEDEARKAANMWKTGTAFSEGERFERTVAGSGYVPSMAHVSAGVYFRLIQYGIGVLPAGSSLCTPPRTEKLGTSSTNLTALDQSLDIDTRNADVIIRSAEGTEYAVHRLVLQLASAEALLQHGDEDGDTTTANRDPIVQVDVPDRILLPLLELCYPFRGGGNFSEDVHIVCDVLAVAARYEMTRIVDVLRRMLVKLGAQHPVPVYFAFVKLGFKEDAWTVAQHAATVDIGRIYTPHMEDVSADVYHSFLRYRHQCQRSILRIITEDVSSHFAEVDMWSGIAVNPSVNEAEWIRLLMDESLREPAGSEAHYGPIPFLMASVDRAKEMRLRCPNRTKHNASAWTHLPPPTLLDIKSYIRDRKKLQSRINAALSDVPKPIEEAMPT